MAIKIALLGLGTVGSGVLKIIKNNQNVNCNNNLNTFV